MHSKLVCHRDLKPNNILVSNDFQNISELNQIDNSESPEKRIIKEVQNVKITDFNVSKF